MLLQSLGGSPDILWSIYYVGNFIRLEVQPAVAIWRYQIPRENKIFLGYSRNPQFYATDPGVVLIQKHTRVV